MSQPQIDPRGAALFAELNAMSDEEKLHSERASVIMVEIMQYLPPELKAMIDNMAIEMGLIPKQAHGYLDDGTPVYNIEQIAKSLGADVEEAKAYVEKMNAATGGKYSTEGKKVNRVN